MNLQTIEMGFMVHTPLAPQTLYPDSDGQPMADNTEQYQWIVRLTTNLRHLLKDEQAFVAGDLLWYPAQVTADSPQLEDEPPYAPRQAPDVLVALGRPPGYRGSYKQWEEDDIAPQVVFEILSPSNTRREMAEKQKFYDDHGALEMYYYDPQRQDFWGFVRENPDEVCTLVTPLYLPWTSPLLKIRFELFEDGLAVFHPNGEPFVEAEAGLLERDAALTERDAARLAEQQAQAERDAALRREQEAIQKRDAAIAKLRELGIDPDTL